VLRFQAKTQVIQTEDSSAVILDLVEKRGAERVGLIVDANVAKASEVRKLLEGLSARLEVASEIVQAVEPTTDMVDELAGKFRSKAPEFFIGIGGGSILDLMKAVSVMTVNPGSVTDYHGTGKPLVAGIAKAAVPTTAGTGSEVTPGAVLVNPKTSFKRGLGGPLVCPDFAILDATLTLSMPLPVAAATGMDALTHTIESFTATSANTMTRMYSREAFSLVWRNLPLTLRGEGGLEARKNVMLGSCLAGFAILNSDTGACHSMAYPLGIYHKIPHGVAVGLIIPKVVEINVEKGCARYAELLDLVEPGASGGPAEKSRRFAQLLARFPAFEHMDKTLARWGVSSKEVDFLAERGLDLKTALGNNPVPFGLDDAKRVLRQLVER